MQWLNVFKHLLPRARAWRLTPAKRLRSFFEGLANTPADVKTFSDSVYQDIDPQSTRELDAWDQQFGLPDVGLSDQDRRDRLDAAWKARGGQDPKYIQDTLQAAGFDVYVHEWWEPVPGRPGGGSINGDVTPTARNPFTYLWDGAAPRQYVGCGHDLAYCNGDSMFANSQDSPPGYPLVNKVLEAINGVIGAGHEQAMAGGDRSYTGASTLSYELKQYIMPADTTKYPYFLYIGGATFPEQATVPLSRQDEFEDLCLKIAPTEQWLGILVTYT